MLLVLLPPASSYSVLVYAGVVIIVDNCGHSSLPSPCACVFALKRPRVAMPRQTGKAVNLAAGHLEYIVPPKNGPELA